LTQTTQYAPVLAKIGAEKGKILSEAKLKALADSKTLTEISAQLRETSYQEQIARIAPPLTGRKLERAYYENLIDTYLKIIDYSPENAAQYLRLYLLRLEAEHIKALLKTTSAKLSVEQKLAKIYFSVEDYLKDHLIIEEVAKASTITGVIHAFKGTEYFAPLNIALKNYEETGSTASFDVFVDKYFYEKLFESYRGLPKKEQACAEFYASMESDGFTLLTLLRGKLLNLDPNWLRLVLPQNYFDLRKPKVEAMVSAIDFDSALKFVLESPYGKYFTPGQNRHETIANAEKAFKKAVLQHAQGSVITETFNIGLPLAFLAQKEAEVHNLVALSLGVEAAMKPEAIRNLFLL
jgi:V/A-type H+/Na+-transporting ATPase subunit C